MPRSLRWQSMVIPGGCLASCGLVIWGLNTVVPNLQTYPPARGGDPLLEALLEADAGAVEANHHPLDESSTGAQTTAHPQLDAPRRPSLAAAAPSVHVALYRQYPLRSLKIIDQGECWSRERTRLQHVDLEGWSDASLTCRSTSRGRIAVNGTLYAGTIRLKREGHQWLAINQLPLERYVASVVGAEMPSSWMGEALKAQAVAARSYALVHMTRPASGAFHLGDTTRWQVYGGVGTTTSSTTAATEATQGQVLRYGQGLVESLYAATQAISLEAHAHLGASMSQHGAQALAQQGFTYTQILDRYYKGAELARITRNGG